MYQTKLRTSRLGDTGLEITRIGFGAWALGGGGWEFGWGPQEDEESIAAIHHALELGINWIDTAAAYGLRPVGGARRSRGGRVARPAVCVHQVLAARGSRAPGGPQPQARIDS